MKLFKVFLVSLLISFFVSCNDNDRFKKHESGFEYKIHTNSENKISIKENDILEISLKYFGQNDSLIFNSENLVGKFRVSIFDTINYGMFHKALNLLKIGDSAEFLIPADDFYQKTMKQNLPKGIQKTEKLKFQIRIHKSVSDQELEHEYEEYYTTEVSKEISLLNDYLKVENVQVKPTISGLYIIRLENGKGKKIEKGQTVIVHYTGSLINGQIFDSSIDRGDPIKFIVGQGDVIPAWEEALLKMKKGDKIKLITPSKLAYADFGYEKIIPPFATLVFEIKILDIQ